MAWHLPKKRTMHHRLAIAVAKLGIPRDANTIAKLSKPKSEATKAKIAASLIGNVPTEMARENLSKALLGVAKPDGHPVKAQVTCPHCSKVGAKMIMARWHFDNCRWHPMRQDEGFPEVAIEKEYKGCEVHLPPWGFVK